MTNKTVLSEIDKSEIRKTHAESTAISSRVGLIEITEQAVLQSPEIQQALADSKRIDWLESSEDSHGFCHAGFGDYIHYAHQVDGYPTVREVIDAAMEKQK